VALAVPVIWFISLVLFLSMGVRGTSFDALVETIIEMGKYVSWQKLQEI
jgi:hypothetical protein